MMTLRSKVLLSIVAAALGGCGEDGRAPSGVVMSDAGASGREDGGERADAGEPGVDAGTLDAGQPPPADGGVRPGPGCDAERVLLLGRDEGYTRFRLALFDPREPTLLGAEEDVSAADNADIIVTSASCGRPVVLQRTAGQLSLQDPMEPLSSIGAIDLVLEEGQSPNPQAVLEVGPDKLYVAPLGLNQVLIVDASSLTVTGSVDLSGFVQEGDVDGLVDPMGLERVGDKVFVALGNYYFDESFTQFFTTSLVAVIELATDELYDVDRGQPGVQAIELRAANPFGGIVYDSAGERLLVGTVEGFEGRTGTIEVIELETLQSQGALVSEGDLGAELQRIAVLPDGRVAAIVQSFPEPASLLVVDPSEALVNPVQWAADVSGVLVTPTGLVAWGSTGVRVFDLETGANITPGGEPIPFPEGLIPDTGASAP